MLLRGAEGFGAQAPPAHRPAALALRGPAASSRSRSTRATRIEAVLEDVRAMQAPRLDHARARPAARAASSARSRCRRSSCEATKLTVYVGRQEQRRRRPAYVAVCDLLHRRGIAGATVLLGVDGTARGGAGARAFFARNAEVPMMVIAVGAGERIARRPARARRAARAEPLLTLERVRVCKRDGELLAAPHELPATDEHGLALWQKLMVYTSERRDARRQAAAPGARPPPARSRRRRRHLPARRLGLPRRPRPARRPPAPAPPPRPGGDDHVDTPERIAARRSRSSTS